MFSIFRTEDSEAKACVRQVPKPVDFIITQSPFWRVLMDEPTPETSKQPSLPATAEGVGVPRREVKGGLEG